MSDIVEKSEHLCEFRDKLCEALGREFVLKAKIERLRAENTRLNELFALKWDATQSAETAVAIAKIERLRAENAKLRTAGGSDAE